MKTNAKRQIKSGKPPFAQGRAARILRVRRETLNRAINAKVPSPRLMSLYRALVAQHSPQPQKP
jgi:hypothetical protein